MKNMFMALALVTLMAAPVLAGGGNKNTTAVTVTNDSSGPVAVIFDNTNTTNAQLAGFTQAQFRNQGGFVLNGGESRTINVRAGNHRIRAAYLNQGTNSIDNATRIGALAVAVGANTTQDIHISGNSSGTATLR